MFSFKKSSDKVFVKPLTTYLGTLIGPTYTQDNYDGTKLANPNKVAVGKYEAVLTQASMVARLPYEMNTVMMAASQLLNFNPLIFNTGLSIIRRNQSRFITKNNTIVVNKIGPAAEGSMIFKNLTPVALAQKGTQIGIQTAHSITSSLKTSFLTTKQFTPIHKIIGDAAKQVGQLQKEANEEAGVYFQLIDNTNLQKSPHAGQKVLYIAFRGTLSLKTALTDLKIASQKLETLFAATKYNGLTGTQAFQQEIAGAEQYRSKIVGLSAINPLGAHSGFVSHLTVIMPELCGELERYMKTYPDISKIIITGHSLGGASATLCAMALAGLRRAGAFNKPIHCITFGAPKLLTEYSRDVFNSLLKGGALTLDRVAGRMANILLAGVSLGTAIDMIPTIPPNFVHPGYMILKTEIKTQSRTGRSKNISDLRKMFGDIDIEGGGFLGFGKWMGFNGLPTYPEFFNNFETLPGIELKDYSSLIKTLIFGTLYPVPGTANEKYNAVKSLVQAITKIQNPFDADKKTDEAEQNASVANIVTPPPNVVQAEESGDETQEGGGPTLTVGKYKEETVGMGSNHIVYKCDKNISTINCHMSYLGVSYGGVVRNFSHNKKPYAIFMVAPNNVIMLGERETISGGRRRNHSRSNYKKNIRKTRNRTRKH